MAFDDLLGFAGLGSANPYGKNSVGQWNLNRGIYQRSDSVSIVFFYESSTSTDPTDKGENRNQKTAIDQISDSGGRRLAIYEYPYQDGQRVLDMGRKGETLSFNIKFFGLDYQIKFEEFLDKVVDSNLPGKIIHPVRGAISVRFRDYEIVHRFDEWNAVTIRAVWVEDNETDFGTDYVEKATVDSKLRDSLISLGGIQKVLTAAIHDAKLITVAKNNLLQRLESITGQVSALLGTLTATFSSGNRLNSILAQAALVGGDVTSLSGGTTSDDTGTVNTLPITYQVGSDPTTQAILTQQTANFVAANQVTTQQALFNANQTRQSISDAIAEAESLLGINAYDMMLALRELAVTVQTVTETCISQEQTSIVLYTVPYGMSLRTVAQKNGLDYNRQNDIENLNPNIGSVNYVPRGTVLTVPAQ